MFVGSGHVVTGEVAGDGESLEVGDAGPEVHHDLSRVVLVARLPGPDRDRPGAENLIEQLHGKDT